MKTTRRFRANNLLWGTALLALCNFSQSKAQTYWDGTQDTVFIGTGTQSDPFLITSAEELAGLAYRTNVRKTPSLKGKSLGVIGKGHGYTVKLAKSRKIAYDSRGVMFYAIRYKGKDAWVSSWYVDKVY